MLERLTAFFMGLLGLQARFRRLVKVFVAVAAIVGPTLLGLRFLAHGAMQCLALNDCEKFFPYLLDHTLIKIAASVVPLLAIVFVMLSVVPKEDANGRRLFGCSYVSWIAFATLLAWMAAKIFWGFLGNHHILRILFAFFLWDTFGELLIKFWKQLASVPKAFAYGRDMSRKQSILVKGVAALITIGIASLIATSDWSHPITLTTQFKEWVTQLSLDEAIDVVGNLTLNVGVLVCILGMLHCLWIGEVFLLVFMLIPGIVALLAESAWPFAITAWVAVISYNVAEFRKKRRERKYSLPEEERA